jgi:hypothetical protein
MIDFPAARKGADDPIGKEALPQPPQEKTTSHQKKQWGADVRSEALPGMEPVLPERLIRPAASPLNPRTGRKPAN